MIFDGKKKFQKRGPASLVASLLLLAANVCVTLANNPPPSTNNKADAILNQTNPLDLLGAWIWTTNTFDGQACQFWHAFDIPADQKVINARLLLTADNEFTVYLDGRQIGHGAEWRELFDYNLVLLTSPGRHVLAVHAINPSGWAGMLLGLRIEFASGESIEIKSDPSWWIVPEEDKSWKEMARPSPAWTPATIIATLGGRPWWTEPVRINSMLTPTPVKIYFWQTVWFQIMFLCLCGIAGVTIFLLTAQLALHRKERWLLQRERARIAMDIHDDVGSRMTHLVLNGEVAQGEVMPGSKAREQLEQICDEARGVLSSIDEILWALNPRRDTLQDFADYVCDYTQKFLAPTSIACVFEVDTETLDAVADLPLRRSLLMSIKETLNNAVKYSEATELHLHISRQRHDLVMVVEDNGKGFDLATIRPGGHGVGNMSKRMQELGGSCRITTQPGKGCRIEFRIPLRRPKSFTPILPWGRK